VFGFGLVGAAVLEEAGRWVSEPFWTWEDE
jgi:hypothetical protein